jgi:hypothetical protein
MSICFTICPSVSLLLLVFKKRSSRHDGATHIVSTSHAPLCTRLFLSIRHLQFLYLLAAAPLHIYDHLFFGARMCTFQLVFLCPLLFVFLSLSLDHGTYKHKPTWHYIRFPRLPFPVFMLLLSLVTLAVLQEGSLYTHCHRLTQIPDLSMVQYNIAILGGPLVTHVNVVFSVWEVARESRGVCGTVLLPQRPVRPCSY